MSERKPLKFEMHQTFDLRVQLRTGEIIVCTGEVVGYEDGKCNSFVMRSINDWVYHIKFLHPSLWEWLRVPQEDILQNKVLKV
jgi:hypothetical protein